MEINLNGNIGNLANTRARRKKFGFGSLLLVLFIGVILISSGILFLKSNSINPGWIKVYGQVVSVSTDNSNGSTTYAPVVQYQVNGQSYKVISNSSSSNYPTIGSQKQVAYDPQQPQDSKIVAGVGTKSILYLLIIIGVLFIVIGPFAFIRSLRRSKDINNLKQTGQKIQGIITDISGNTYNNQNNTYRIVVSATNSSGNVQSYTSDPLYSVGGLLMVDFRNNPIPIDVYINPANPNDYYVDISEVPNLTPERISDLIKSYSNKQSGVLFQSGQQIQPIAPQNINPQPLNQPQNYQPETSVIPDSGNNNQNPNQAV